MIRVFVVDDSTFFRKALVRVLGSNPNIQVVGEAANGLDALARIPSRRPDVVTLDIDMPLMNGLDTLRSLRVILPHLPVIMLSAQAKEGAHMTLDALAAGAVDFIDKANFNIMDFDQLSKELINRILQWEPRAPQKNKGITGHPSLEAFPPSAAHKFLPSIPWHRFDLCVIGASTGGPRAIQVILEKIPPAFPIPILLIQHMPKGFTAPFAERLNRQCQLSVAEARNGDRLTKGKALLAPAGKHVHVTPGCEVILLEQDLGRAHIPSVDVAMLSAAESLKSRVLGVLLTGMGSDGAEGMLAIHNAGGLTLAESEESCVIFGMPRAAHMKGAVTHLLSLQEIAHLLRAEENGDT